MVESGTIERENTLICLLPLDGCDLLCNASAAPRYRKIFEGFECGECDSRSWLQNNGTSVDAYCRRPHLNHMLPRPCPEPNGDREIMVYETRRNRPNPGKNEQEQIEACSKACLDKLPGLRGVSWKDFVARGFVVNVENGDCFCEKDDSATCKRRSLPKHVRYDFIGE